MSVKTVQNQETKSDEIKYLRLAETNRLIRKSLKLSFPGVRFTVRGERYAGGSSTEISWTDGPTAWDVDSIVQPFGCRGFNSMTDMQFAYRQALLPSGRIVRIGTGATQGSRGSVAALSETMPDGAMPVSSGVGYVFTRRTLSPNFVELVRAGLAWLSIREYSVLLNRSPHVCGSDEAYSIARITEGPII